MRNFGVTSMWDSRKRFRAHISMLFGSAGQNRADMLLTNQLTDVVDTDVNFTKTAAAESSFAGCNSGGTWLGMESYFAQQRKSGAYT